MIKSIELIDYHRNGISGEGFYVVNFTDTENGAMMAVVFPPKPIDDPDNYDHGKPDWDSYTRKDWENPRVAVFQADKLPDVRFGHNSWRGDNYAADLYAAIKKWSYGEGK
jgi:hypothetical protein